jgi:serine/threonine protein phosphatase PrpC
MRLRAGVVSDCGLVRSANEDSFLLRPGLYAVCDGMGGARAGEVASQMACLGLVGVDPNSAGEDQLRQAVAGANRAIIQRSATEGELLGMGTTLTAALIRDQTVMVAHLGDSRAYLLHGDRLTQLTSDHSWVGEMMRRGEITAAQAANHPHRSVITRALGTDLDADPEMVEVAVVAGDRVLICSDGLTGMVDDDEIARVMQQGLDPQATAQALAEAALAHGGEDNVTVVVVDAIADAKPGEEEATSWADMRVLIGPSDRIAKPSVLSRHGRRMGGAARRGAAIARPGSRVGAAIRLGQRAEATSAADSVAYSAAGLSVSVAEAEAAKAGEPHDEAVVPPPAGPGRRKARAAGSAGPPWWRRKWLSVLFVVILIVAIGVGAFAWYNSTVYYVGTYQGKVALYRGLPEEFLGVEFSSLVEISIVKYESLSLHKKTRVDAHRLVSKEQGELMMDALSTEQ